MRASMSMVAVCNFNNGVYVALSVVVLQIAANAAWCAKQPWAGVAGTYEASRDPWKRGDLAAFRREFYQKSMQWLSQPGARTYPVSEIFVWGMASWDMFGIYPDSSTSGGTYRDFSLMPEIAQHNVAVIASKVRRLTPSFGLTCLILCWS
jgi:hypothetical protein